MAKIKIIEVGPRDGLQDEATQLSLPTKYKFVKKLMACGEQHIEIGAFVSPRWVPQMAGSDKLVKKVLNFQKSSEQYKDTHFSVLTPNLRGATDALKTPIKEIAIFGACSESFSKKNINCSTEESFKRFEQVTAEAKKHKVKVRAYLSTVFGCPFEGKVDPKKVLKLVDKMFRLGVYEVSLGDTIGVATPKQVEVLLKNLKAKHKINRIALHMHNTRGTALANVLKGLEMGVRSFDTSLGGLGGCPYAKGATGNLATEELVYMLHGMGHKTGIDLVKLVRVRDWMEVQMGRSLPSLVSKEKIKKSYW